MKWHRNETGLQTCSSREIPATAAVQTQDRFRVFLVNKEGIANGKVITVNEQKAGNQFIVTSGLEGGEEIVAEGAGMVKEGQKVK